MGALSCDNPGPPATQVEISHLSQHMQKTRADTRLLQHSSRLWAAGGIGHQPTFHAGPRSTRQMGWGWTPGYPQHRCKGHPGDGAEHKVVPGPAQGEAESPTLSSSGASWLRWGGLGETFEGREGWLAPRGLCQASSSVLQDSFKARMISLPRCDNIWRDFAAFWLLHHACS